ncbi:hypothetical protein nbrc107696_31450 [Gordonia spumicola]|uniref:Endolytic murein transglycosylase n=1 Tax=Gordonia spumicola TaxID=589161 RepID=A0A7I9VBH0_9ACTN|nr:endolytic transglycosylase MltG [Gordonia spumicola]GEE02699.1 hypothetical protein nbrc107696_31450 [Gordonia spumicola]
MTDQDRTPREGDDARPRHSSAAPPGDADPRRFFPDSSGVQEGNRRRRRRGPGDPTTTGNIPIIRVQSELPDPTIEYRTPEPQHGAPPSYFEVRYRDEPASAEPMMRFTEPVTRHVETPGRHAEPARVDDALYSSPAGADTEPFYRDEPARQAVPQPPVPQAPVPQPEPQAPVAEPAAPQHQSTAPVYPRQPQAEPVVDETTVAAAPVEPFTEPTVQATPVSAPDILDAVDDDDSDTGEIPVHGGAMPARKKSRRLLFAIAGVILVAVLVLGGLGLKWLGVFESQTDYSSTTGSGSVLVEVPADAAIRDVGQTLTDAGVVGSQRAFVDAAEGGAGVSAGFYELPKGISAKAALEMMSGDDRRVGRFVVPEGLTLDSKKSSDGTTRPGIFQMISKATTFSTDDKQYGVTVDQLKDAAANSTPEQLGVPDWATAKVKELTGDHRRIEGLIASGAWEDIDPRLDARAILKDLITRSVSRFTAWGLLSGNDAGKSPYDELTIASIVEAEAQHEDDFPKVARVIVNRLAQNIRLQMDSTVNYTADVADIDVHGESYLADNKWNTYQHDGLPLTPIGAVGERALAATENPTPGDWVYFVTVDKEGTTLFAKTFAQHKKNRQVACRNKFLTVGCE